ncbi:UNVERIFIED_CONTAM: Cycloeucalenol cycloisomerase [Sesamum calycinum]|uniref:Cycloeucalenol cycloisomerase n=1 Tax=Sesamum calycinum TaxID=2727403 RepID=A0AAW2SEJ4_9LAMI
MGGGEVVRTSSNLWLAQDPSKRWAEIFFLLYTPFWLTLCLGIVVPYKLYENFTELEYLLIGLVSALPAFIIPMIFVGKGTENCFVVVDSTLSWKDRFGLKIQHSIAHLPENTQLLFRAAWILALSYFIAYLETLAISNFPYYEFVDRASMYKVGSLFYAIYFLVSFPMFMRIDEKPGDRWNLPRVAIDALGAAMLVTIILDLWRLFLGPIVPLPDAKQCPQPGLPWFPKAPRPCLCVGNMS